MTTDRFAVEYVASKAIEQFAPLLIKNMAISPEGAVRLAIQLGVEFALSDEGGAWLAAHERFEEVSRQARLASIKGDLG